MKTRMAGITLVVIGVITPIIIDRYEAANHLNISRDIGALPWLLMTFAGAVLIGASLSRKA